MEQENRTPDERRENLYHRVANMRNARVDSMNAMDSPERIIMAGVTNEYPNIPVDEARQVAREVALAPHGIKIKLGKDDVPVEDLQFRIANSIEIINCETTSVNEYFTWIEDGHNIIRHMNDGEVTTGDLSERNDFLGTLGQREAELMTCLALYQASATPMAQQKYTEMYQKLTKLREIRSSIEHSTSNEVDKKVEQELARQYYVVIKNLDVVSDDEKKRLKIYQADAGENFLGAMQERLYNSGGSPAERFIQEKSKDNSKESLAKRIETLRGRKTVDEMLDENAKKREDLRKRAFDRDRFMSLSENPYVNTM